MVAAYIFVSVEPGKNAPVLGALRKAPGVQQAHICWGAPDIFAFVEVADDEALSDLVLGEIQSITGIRGTETHVVVPEVTSVPKTVTARKTPRSGRPFPGSPVRSTRATAASPRSRATSASSEADTAATARGSRRRP